MTVQGARLSLYSTVLWSLTDSPTHWNQPLGLSVLLSSADFDRRVDLHGFLCNPIYKPTGKENKTVLQSRSAPWSVVLHHGAWCFTVERGASPCSVVLASRRQLQHTCDGPESPPHFPAGTGLPPGHPGQGSPHFREQATCKQVQDSQNLGGAQLYISCDVTKTGGKCRLTDVFQSTLGFSFVSVIVVAKSAPPRAQSENCFYYKSPEMRTSATVFITHLIKWPPEEGLKRKECCHTYRGTWGLSRGQGRPGHQRWHSAWWSWLVPLSFVFHCANHKPTAGGRLTLLSQRGTVPPPGHSLSDPHSVTYKCSMRVLRGWWSDFTSVLCLLEVVLILVFQ